MHLYLSYFSFCVLNMKRPVFCVTIAQTAICHILYEKRTLYFKDLAYFKGMYSVHPVTLLFNLILCRHNNSNSRKLSALS